MQNKNKIKLIIVILTLLGLACLCSPSSFLERQVEGVADEFQQTLEAEAGMSMEEMAETGEAFAQDFDPEATGEFTYGEDVETEFPMPEDASNPTVVAGVLNFGTSLSKDEMVQFYQAEFLDLGYTERAGLTVIDEVGAYLVFDGHASGQAIIVQMIDLGPLGLNVSIWLEAI